MADFPALYMPALKWKQGEQRAVKPLVASQRAAMLPIVEVQDRPYDWDEKRYTKSWDKYIDDVVKATVSHWGTAHEVGVDQLIDDNDVLSSYAGTPWEYLFSSLWAAGVKAVPVVSRRASASETAALLSASRDQKNTRWILRYGVDEDESMPSPAKVEAWFRNARAALGAAHASTTAVLDLGHVGDDGKKPAAKAVAELLETIAAQGSWRHLALLCGAFPKNLAGVPKGTKQITRLDWALYGRVRALAQQAGLSVHFGDYGVSHVEPFDGDPRKMVMSANLRYTHWDYWHVLKARSVRDHGHEQYRDLCKLLILLPIYMQPGFSHGDASFETVATSSKAGPGNATSWRRDATNHHLHVVLHQLANLSGP